jgi:hypothetical protein
VRAPAPAAVRHLAVGLLATAGVVLGSLGSILETRTEPAPLVVEAPSQVGRSETISLAGVGAKPGSRVVVERLLPGGWQEVGSVPADRLGRFRLSFPPEARRRRLLLRARSGPSRSQIARVAAIRPSRSGAPQVAARRVAAR